MIWSMAGNKAETIVHRLLIVNRSWIKRLKMEKKKIKREKPGRRVAAEV